MWQKFVQDVERSEHVDFEREQKPFRRSVQKCPAIAHAGIVELASILLALSQKRTIWKTNEDGWVAVLAKMISATTDELALD